MSPARKGSAPAASLKDVAPLALAVGDFMRYWGFRRIHGQIWTCVFLSREPLSGTEIGRALKASKALISPALAELVDHGLIEPAEASDRKTKRYVARTDFFAVIRDVLNRREKKMILDAKHQWQALSSRVDERGEGALDAERLETVGALVMTAELAIAAILSSARSENLSSLPEVLGASPRSDG